jgi:hypothetical protein
MVKEIEYKEVDYMYLQDLETIYLIIDNKNKNENWYGTIDDVDKYLYKNITNYKYMSMVEALESLGLTFEIIN